ncbi:GNAT family N-acetyltransferase [Sulfitobacter sp.]|uniref:GNAT family N-acetyltransferase n=1 Tax=Sulfitobacter sp. TaxID=1903071 RepID=UPI0030034556
MNNPQIQIRAAVSEDAAALTSLIFRSKKSNGYDDAFMELCVDVLRVTPEILKQRHAFLAEADNQLLGCAMLDPQDANTAEVCAFFIAPEHKRRGVGKVLWNKLLSHAQALGFTKLVLDADPEAVPFYKRLGFKIIHDTPSEAIPDRVIPHMARSI